MHTRYVDGITIRPLRDGDEATVAAMFSRLGDASRAKRFCTGKPRLTSTELTYLSRVDAGRHVLVGYVDGDPLPVAIARLVRAGDSAEVAFEVADDHQGKGIGTVLTRELAADARAAGVRRLLATTCGDNPRATSVLAKVSSSLQVRILGRERELVAALDA
jgi:GNAT superfamily N-acetyltransferase